MFPQMHPLQSKRRLPKSATHKRILKIVLSENRGRSHPPLLRQYKTQCQRFHQLIHGLDLRDLWCIHHPNERAYTFYSACHQLYSRQDFFLITRHLLSYLASTDLITWSDHHVFPGKETHWRLNEGLLNNLHIYADLAQTIKNYFIDNSQSVEKTSVFWEAHKALL